MFKNYLKVAVRNLLKQKTYTFINVAGLAIGMTCFVLIVLFIRFEVSHDSFHEKADRIYRVALERTYPDKVRNWGMTAVPLAQTLQTEFDEVEQATRLLAANNSVLVTFGDKKIEGNQVIYTDPNFFEVFSIKMLEGNPATVLGEQNSAVVTEEAAKRFFGSDDPIGKTVEIIGRDYTIKGVTEKVPLNSHFHYDFLLSASTLPFSRGTNWINNWSTYTYVLLTPGFDPAVFEERLDLIVQKYMAPEVLDEVKTSYEEFVANGNGYKYFIQPIKEIHLTSKLEQELEANGNINYVYLFSIIAAFILGIACINFMNLATARSASRAKEVGVRKTLGSNRIQLIFQFLTESLLLSGLALVVSLVLTWLLLPYFNTLTGKTLALDYFGNFQILPAFIVFTVLVGLMAGSYPALFLSAFRPISVLKGDNKVKSANKLRNGLVIFQFVISIVLLVGTFVIDHQIKFMLTKDLGFDKAHVIVVQNARLLGTQVPAFKNELLSDSKVLSASGSFNAAAGAFDSNVHLPVGATEDRAVSMSMIFADYDYAETMGMELLQGRNFSKKFSLDSSACILNETAVKMLGLESPIDSWITDRDNDRLVVGVLKDFHFKSLHNDISPLVYVGNRGNRAGVLSVRIQQEQMNETIAFIENKWREFTGDQPFAWSFLDDNLASQYQAEQETRRMTQLFSQLAVLIGCLGLFGLAAFTAEQRTKEIGVRKVLGASIANIILLLVKEFTKLVTLAFVIATPISFLAMNQWLQSFAYKTNMPLTAFIFAGGLALLVALVTVSYQAIKAALPNPVESLRYE